MFWMSVLACLYVCSFNVFVYFVLLCVLCFCSCYDSSTSSKDIVRCRCGVDYIPFCTYFL